MPLVPGTTHRTGGALKLPPIMPTSLGPPASSAPSAASLLKTNPKGKRSRVFYRAAKGFLSFVGGDDSVTTKSPAVILREASCTPKFPSKDAQGTPAEGATCICFAYTLVGNSTKGCRFGDKCKFSHLDAAALPPGAMATHFAALRIAIDGPLKPYYALTAEGARFCR
jgi:hypothetical protein